MLTLKQIAENDGLTVEDWKAWFTGMSFAEPLPIIHFTKFRY
jgi:LysM repeat protein